MSIPIGTGRLTVGHRPAMAALENFPASYDRVVTLLSKREDPDSIKHRCKRLNLAWTHLPLWHVWDEDPKVIAAHAHIVFGYLQAGERVYLHCSAGIHRTGYVTYMILQEAGYNKHDALNRLCSERPVAADEYRRFLARR